MAGNVIAGLNTDGGSSGKKRTPHRIYRAYRAIPNGWGEPVALNDVIAGLNRRK